MEIQKINFRETETPRGNANDSTEYLSWPLSNKRSACTYICSWYYSAFFVLHAFQRNVLSNIPHIYRYYTNKTSKLSYFIKL